jgi:hypothetical protein
MRELVEPPDPGEPETMSAWLTEEADDAVRERIVARLSEIEVLYPESGPEVETVARAGDETAPRPS